MSCCQCRGADRLFSGWYVARELRSYRRKGPRATTRMLIEALVAEGVAGATLLDVGGGVGAIQHALLDSGAREATGAEAAAAYLEAAREEARRRGHAERVTYHQGDFVELADRLRPADIVTLDRVICCYHDVDSLVQRSVEKSRRLYGLVYPRDVWWTRLGNHFLNFFLWISRNPFRVFVHPTHTVDAIIRSAGFERRFLRATPFWQVVVYAR